jgi:dynein heavy chain
VLHSYTNISYIFILLVLHVYVALLQGFVVEVIQFRNAFDAQGPAVPGIPPLEAVQRLDEFQQLYVSYDAKRNTLNSVSKLFGIAPKKFPELDRTSEVRK